MARNISSSSAASCFLNVVFRDADGNCSTLGNALRERPTLPKSNVAFQAVRSLEQMAWDKHEDLEDGQDCMVIDHETLLRVLQAKGLKLEVRVRKPGEGMVDTSAATAFWA